MSGFRRDSGEDPGVEPGYKTVMIAGSEQLFCCKQEVVDYLIDELGLRNPRDFTVGERPSRQTSHDGERVYALSIEFKPEVRLSVREIEQLDRMMGQYDFRLHENPDVRLDEGGPEQGPHLVRLGESGGRRLRPISPNPKNARVFTVTPKQASSFDAVVLDASMHRDINLIEGEHYTINQGELVGDPSNTMVQKTIQFNIGTMMEPDKIRRVEALLKALEPAFGKPKSGHELSD